MESYFDRLLPLGIQSFEYLRQHKYLYVDKTQYILPLLRGKYYFLSRPRRFGKSLFLSTLAAYFSGKQELFDGLYIAEKEEAIAQQLGRAPWAGFPVLYIDLNSSNYGDSDELESIINRNLERYERLYNVPSLDMTISGRFENLITQVYDTTGSPVVVLIDEYDKPLVHTLTHTQQELHEKNRNILAGFYSVLKAHDQYIYFAFLTGITKFSKLSIFSGLNNLVDISLDPTFATICGITEEELCRYFPQELDRLVDAQNTSREQLLCILKEKYDGYQFAINAAHLYNPFNLLHVFDSQSFGYYWFASGGTPTFLIKKLQEREFEFPKLDADVRIARINLENPQIVMNDPLSILYQAGYLTIKDYDSEYEEYILGFPNNEVRTCFYELLVKQFLSSEQLFSLTDVNNFLRAIRAGDVETFMNGIHSLVAGMSYSSDKTTVHEWAYQMVFYTIFRLMGLRVHTEVHNLQGRADCVVETETHVYVFEFKLWSAGTPEEALVQIREKGYAEPYMSLGKEIILVGVSFDEAKRNIGAWALYKMTGEQ